MPTDRQRYQVTETDALARALELAEREWPGRPRSQLIERLAVVGAEHLEHRAASDRRIRTAALDEMAELLAGTWPPDYLEALRSEWPE